ncbi:MAG: ComEC/Rec2 family competence protein [bacterium]|nr:ComEC/Rec2 family competence protein [bacterium]
MKIRRIIYTIFFVLVLASVFVFTLERERGLLEIYFLDIGQGDAVYIRTPGGHDMLIDGGPSRIILQKLSEVMPFYDRSIDVVIETHPDADHIGGLPSVLERYRIGLFIEPGINSKNVIDDELHRLRAEKDIPSKLARRGMIINFGDGSHFDILYPDTNVSGFKNTNDASIVGQMKYGSTTIMLTGDSPKKIENYLIGMDGEFLKSDVLKAGHHGSHTSSGEKYVKAVAPQYVVISAGKKNRYGHPHADVLKIFEKLGIQIIRTDREGTIKFVSDGKSISTKVLLYKK